MDTTNTSPAPPPRRRRSGTTYRVSPEGDSILQRLAAWHGVSKAAALELTLRQAAREYHMQPLEPQP